MKNISDGINIFFYDMRAGIDMILPVSCLIKGDCTFKIKLNEKEYSDICKYLDDKDYQNVNVKLNEDIARLYIPPYKNNKSYLIDREARVRCGEEKDSYLMSPYKFLLLNDYLDYVKYKNGITIGIPKLYLKKR